MGDGEEVGGGGLDQHHLQHVGVDRLEEHGVFKDLPQQGRVYAGPWVHPVLGERDLVLDMRD